MKKIFITALLLLLGISFSLIPLYLSSSKKMTSEDYTAEELAKLSPEELAKLVPKDILERFTPEELANFTADELKHIVPSKFPEPKTQYPLNIMEPKELPSE